MPTIAPADSAATAPARSAEVEPAPSRRDWLAIATLTLVSAALTLPRLDYCYLWQDESQTALLSRMVVEHGIPLGFDGRNYFSQEQGAECDSAYRWRWHTWLPFYVLAGFFSAFGESTLVARLPFALFGVAGVLATWWLARTLWPDRRVAFAAGVALAFLVPYLILSRQCRYYSMTALFNTLAMVGYWRLLNRERRGAALLVASLTLLFQSHFLYTATAAGAFLAHCLIWDRSRLKALLAAFAVTAILCAPWIIWLASMNYSARYGHVAFRLPVALNHLAVHFDQLQEHVISVFVMCAPLIFGLIAVFRGQVQTVLASDLWRPLSLLLLVSATMLVGVSASSPDPFFRYLSPLLPIAAVLVGLTFVEALRLHWLVATLVATLYFIHQPLIDHFHELTHPMNGPLEGIVAYLNANAQPDDVVAITYDDLPLKFYTKLRVIGCLTGEDTSAARDADWIILRRRVIVKEFEVPFRELLQETLTRRTYDSISLKAPDTMHQNREDPAQHRFRSAEGGPRVVVWHRHRFE
ncbi:MAG: glycosyltransferase family 39 protein [Planctomycetaceae bacterium]